MNSKNKVQFVNYNNDNTLTAPIGYANYLFRGVADRLSDYKERGMSDEYEDLSHTVAYAYFEHRRAEESQQRLRAVEHDLKEARRRLSTIRACKSQTEQRLVNSLSQAENNLRRLKIEHRNLIERTEFLQSSARSEHDPELINIIAELTQQLDDEKRLREESAASESSVQQQNSDLTRRVKYLESLLRRNGIYFNPISGHAANHGTKAA